MVWGGVDSATGDRTPVVETVPFGEVTTVEEEAAVGVACGTVVGVVCDSATCPASASVSRALLASPKTSIVKDFLLVFFMLCPSLGDAG